MLNRYYSSGLVTFSTKPIPYLAVYPPGIFGSSKKVTLEEFVSYSGDYSSSLSGGGF